MAKLKTASSGRFLQNHHFKYLERLIAEASKPNPNLEKVEAYFRDLARRLQGERHAWFFVDIQPGSSKLRATIERALNTKNAKAKNPGAAAK